MAEELHLDAQDYTNAANIFLIGYIVFQLPATVFIKKVGPPLQFGVAMIAWGALTACTTSIHSKGALLALRFLIGSCESAVQGAVFCKSLRISAMKIELIRTPQICLSGTNTEKLQPEEPYSTPLLLSQAHSTV
jgi:MFS family permease